MSEGGGESSQIIEICPTVTKINNVVYCLKM